MIKEVSLRGLSKKHLAETMQETEILLKLDCENAIKSYGYFKTKDTLSIVMEYCPNGDLSKLIDKQEEKGRPFQEKEIWDIVL